MNLYHLPNYAGTGSAAKVHLLWIVIVLTWDQAQIIVAVVIHSLFSFRLARQNVITRRNENGAQSQVIIVFSLTRETSSLFVHPQTFLDVNEIFVQFHCLSSYWNNLFPCSHILSSHERLCFVVSLGIFGSKNGVSIFSWLSINTVVAKKKKKKKLDVSHGSYNVDKVFNFSSRLELEFGLGHLKVLHFFIRSGKVLEIRNLVYVTHHFL